LAQGVRWPKGVRKPEPTGPTRRERAPAFQHVRRRLYRLLRGTRGANLLESAIVAPLLLLLTFGVADFALLLWVWLALQNGASLATRHSITGNFSEDAIRTAMRNATPMLTIEDDAFAFSHFSPGGSSWVGGVGGPNDIGKLTVNYTWTVITPLLRPFFTDGKIQFVVESAMKNEGRFE
jgi:hypothetical protein